MSLVKSFPNWPIVVADALTAKRSETPHGCGSCIHAAWMSPVDNSPGAKAPVEFSLGACGAAVQLERGRAGLRATTFCTSWNMPLAGARAGTAETGVGDPGKLRHHAMPGGEPRSSARSPSLGALLR
jgi:hypothetical protein